MFHEAITTFSSTDLVAGPFWFKGPDFKEAKSFRPGKALPPTVYQEHSFLSWIEDSNGDGKLEFASGNKKCVQVISR